MKEFDYRKPIPTNQSLRFRIEELEAHLEILQQEKQELELYYAE